MKRILKNKNNPVGEFNPRLEEIKNLLAIYSAVQKGLLNRTATANNGEEVSIFSTKNIVGEYAEILVCEKLGYIQEVASNKDYDCICGQEKIQIKSRQIVKSKATSGQYEMGGIKENALDKVDYVIAIVFKADFSIKYAYKISKDEYKNIATKKDDTYTLRLNEKKAKEIDKNHPDYNITQDLQ